MIELTVGDVRPRVQYTADGVQTSFVYPFPIFDAADLKVFFDDGGTLTSYTITASVTAAAATSFSTRRP